MISSTMNLVMTVLGFAMSATFVVFVCARLLCVRVQLRRRPRRPSDSAQHDLERTLSGVEASVVASFPTIKYSQEVFASRDDALCTVCLGEYEEKEVLRVIPRCGHAFHVECIDAWLKLHSTCPICRVSVRGREDGGGISSPLISRSARPRYSPRAVPDHMFEEQQQAQWRSSDADLESGSEQPIPGRRKWGARLWRKGEEVCASSSSASACAVVAQPRVRDPFSFSLRLNAAFSEDEEGASSPDPVSASCKSHPAAIAS